MKNQSTQNKSFILHLDSLVILEKLTDEQAGRIFKAIYQFQQSGEVPILDFALDLALTPFINQFIRDKEKWSDECKKSSEKGKLGNLKRWHFDLFQQVENGTLSLETAISNSRNRPPIIPNHSQSFPIPKSLDSKNDSKNKNKKENNNDNNLIAPTLPEFINNDLFDGFIEMRKKIKKPMTEKAKELIIEKLSQFEKKQAGFANKALKNSIENSWQGVFEPANNQQKTNSTGSYLDFLTGGQNGK